MSERLWDPVRCFYLKSGILMVGNDELFWKIWYWAIVAPVGMKLYLILFSLGAYSVTNTGGSVSRTSLCRVITGAAPLIFVWVDCAARELGWVCIIKKMRRWALSKSVLFCYKECSSAGIFYDFLFVRLWSYNQLHINCFFSVDNSQTPLLNLKLMSQTFFYFRLVEPQDPLHLFF